MRDYKEHTIQRGKKFVEFSPCKYDQYTLYWSWTGLKQTIPKEDARLIWKGLWVMGFKEKKPAPPPSPKTPIIRDRELQLSFLGLWSIAANKPGYSYDDWQELRDRLAIHSIIV